MKVVEAGTRPHLPAALAFADNLCGLAAPEVFLRVGQCAPQFRDEREIGANGGLRGSFRVICRRLVAHDGAVLGFLELHVACLAAEGFGENTEFNNCQCFILRVSCAARGFHPLALGRTLPLPC